MISEAEKVTIVQSFLELLYLNEIDVLKEQLDKIKRLFPNSPETLSLQGQLLRYEGKIKEGNALILKAIKKKAAEIDQNYSHLNRLQKIILFQTVVYLGGDTKCFFDVGKLQLQVLQDYGLLPSHRVLDIGSGCFRGGLFISSYLEPERYYAIEPNLISVYFGTRHVLGRELCLEKKPQLNHNSDFDLDVFDTKFDYFIARSIWTHTSRSQIEKMLEQFILCSKPESHFFTSYFPAVEGNDYTEDGWLGHSHVSEKRGHAHHSFEWIQQACEERNLDVERLEKYRTQGQIWLKITHDG